jgi:membrane protein insertase Oxa1/YidC/SpoIIIJ
VWKCRAETYPSFAVGGEYWFTDLTVCDPTYILPAITSATMLASIELGGDTGQAMKDQAATQKIMFRTLACMVLPISVWTGMPNAVFMYWISSNTFALTQVTPGPFRGIPRASRRLSSLVREGACPEDPGAQVVAWLS